LLAGHGAAGGCGGVPVLARAGRGRECAERRALVLAPRIREREKEEGKALREEECEREGVRVMMMCYVDELLRDLRRKPAPRLASR